MKLEDLNERRFRLANNSLILIFYNYYMFLSSFTNLAYESGTTILV